MLKYLKDKTGPKRLAQRRQYFFSRRGHLGRRKKERREKSVSELKSKNARAEHARPTSVHFGVRVADLHGAYALLTPFGGDPCGGVSRRPCGGLIWTLARRLWAPLFVIGRERAAVGPLNSLAPPSLKFVLARDLGARALTNCIRCGAAHMCGKTCPLRHVTIITRPSV